MRLIIRALGAIALMALVVAALPGMNMRQADAAGGPSDAFSLSDLDRSCRACSDFWQFATGGWRQRAVLPAGYSSWGTFDEIYARNRTLLRSVLDTAASDTLAARGSEEQKIGSFYKACLDQSGLNARGLFALQPEFDRINAIDSTAALVREIGRIQRLRVDVGLPFDSEPDTRNSSRTIASIGYGGIGMPTREEYLLPENATHRTAYVAYLEKQFISAGETPAQSGADAKDILDLETTFARATPPDADLRDPLATYHPMSLAKLRVIAPHMPWKAYLSSFGQPQLTSLDVNLPKYVSSYDAQLFSTPLPVWRAYLRAHIITAFASALPKQFDDAEFDFFSRTLNGVKVQRERWKRCISDTDRNLTDPLGKIYVEKVFPASSKALATELVDNLQSTLRDDLSTLAWMSPATRKQALMKLAAYVKKVGYPDAWVDYSAVTIDPRSTYLDDLLAARAFATQRDLARIGKPTDRTRWADSPPTVNAYYDTSNNEIVFPAGILERPFFDARADDALNYGAIGAIIGHEMTHGFDDIGRQYDAHGNLRKWWTAADGENFVARSNCIVHQYSGYVLAGTHENGRLVQGEAIADLGGATIAFRAFERTPEAKAHTMVDGFTPEQRFFLSYAQVWREIITPQAQRQYVLGDPHPDDKYRLVGTLGNMPEFQAAFACARTDPMIRKNRCRIW